MVRNPQCECPHIQLLFTLIGKKWALFILNAVQEGAHSFTEIRKNIGDANTKILTDRLAELVEYELLKKDESGKYHLTPLGNELTTRLMDVAHWWGDIMCPIDHTKTQK